jgi:hypothetical protein
MESLSISIRGSALLLAALGCCPAYTAAAYTVMTFDFDTGNPTLPLLRNLPVDQTVDGVGAHFSAISGNFSIQNDVSTGFSLSQFSGKWVYPNNRRGDILRIQFDHELSDLSFTFATTDYQTSHPQPTPIVMTAYLGATSTTPVGSVTQRAVYGGDDYPMGTLTFSSTASPFDRVEIRVQAGGDAAVFVDDVTVKPTPQLDIWVAGPDAVMVAWPASSPGYVLQESRTLEVTDWVTVNDPVEVVNGQNQVLRWPATGYAFYRLARP